MAATIDYTDVPVDKVCETCLFSEKKTMDGTGSELRTCAMFIALPTALNVNVCAIARSCLWIR